MKLVEEISSFFLLFLLKVVKYRRIVKSFKESIQITQMGQFRFSIFYSAVHDVWNRILGIKFLTKSFIQFWKKMFSFRTPNRLKLLKSVKSKFIDPSLELCPTSCMILDNLVSFRIKEYELILSVAEVSQNVFCVKSILFRPFEIFLFIINVKRHKYPELFIMIFKAFLVLFVLIALAHQIFILAGWNFCKSRFFCPQATKKYKLLYSWGFDYWIYIL